MSGDRRDPQSSVTGRGGGVQVIRTRHAVADRPARERVPDFNRCGRCIGGWVDPGLRGAFVARKVRHVNALHSLLIRRMLAGLVVMAVAGCADSAADPVLWWHDLEGGLIAEQRPPPPNADQPYPNLSTVPARPAAPDAEARAATVSALAADRANAQYAASVAPLPATPAPLPRPAPPPAAPDPDEAAGASLPAAAAPSAPSAPVIVRERPAVAEGRPADPLASLPSIPQAPPSPPQLAGAPSTTVPVPLLTAPKPPPPLPLPPGAPVLVAFEPGSAELSKAMQTALLNLGHIGGAKGIAVTGFGDADSADAIVQSQALPLALARARAIAAQLHTAGVATDRMRVSAAAEGHGGAAKMID